MFLLIVFTFTTWLTYHTWKTMFSWQSEVHNKQHIALLIFGLISCIHTIDALEGFDIIHLITACWSTRGLPCFLDKGKLLTRKKTLLLYLAVESALHKPNCETSCCVSYFCLALAKQFTSFIIDIVKLMLFRDYFFVLHPFLPSCYFPERGPWHKTDSKLIEKKRYWRKFAHEGFHLRNIWYWKVE